MYYSIYSYISKCSASSNFINDFLNNSDMKFFNFNFISNSFVNLSNFQFQFENNLSYFIKDFSISPNGFSINPNGLILGMRYGANPDFLLEYSNHSYFETLTFFVLFTVSWVLGFFFIYLGVTKTSKKGKGATASSSDKEKKERKFESRKKAAPTIGLGRGKFKEKQQEKNPIEDMNIIACKVHKPLPPHTSGHPYFYFVFDIACKTGENKLAGLLGARTVNTYVANLDGQGYRGLQFGNLTEFPSSNNQAFKVAVRNKTYFNYLKANNNVTSLGHEVELLRTNPETRNYHIRVFLAGELESDD